MPQIRRLIIRTIESSTIDRDSNITDTVTLSETLSMYSTKTLGPRMEPWETSVLTRYSCKVFLSRTTRSSLLMSNDKLGQIPDLKFHKTWVCVEDQQAKPSRKPWIYQVLQFYQIQCHKIYSWTRRTETILEINKKALFLKFINNSINLVVFSRRP